MYFETLTISLLMYILYQIAEIKKTIACVKVELEKNKKIKYDE